MEENIEKKKKKSFMFWYVYAGHKLCEFSLRKRKFSSRAEILLGGIN